MTEYYHEGTFDNCRHKWTELFGCISLKTKPQSQIQVIYRTSSDHYYFDCCFVSFVIAFYCPEVWEILLLASRCLSSASQHCDQVFMCFQKFKRNLGGRFCIVFAPDLVWSITYLSTPTVMSWWSQWVVMAVHHCYSWWRGWSDTLWVTLIRLRLQSLSCYLQVVVKISAQFHRYNGFLVSC
jgi:hypothetical protein